MLKLPKNKTRLIWLCGVAGVLLLVLLLWKVPQWSVPDSVTDEKDRAELLNAIRENVLKVIQTVGGLGFIATAYLAWRNFQLTEDRNVSDRFTRAVEMLADERLEVRLGGIYSLERIAKDSEEDHPVVMEVLTAFVRERTSPIWKEPGSFIQRYLPKASTRYSSKPVAKFIQQDIQSALTVIGRRTPYLKTEGLTNLVGTDLGFAELIKANLIGALLWGADLRCANLAKADLRFADLNWTNLSHAVLWDADLRHADLVGAKLYEADLCWSNLSKANLFEADLSNILWNEETQWPDPSEMARP